MSRYKGILVLAEANDRELSTDSLRVLGRAREIADSLGGRVEVAMTASSSAIAEMLVRYGADVVHWSPYDFGFDLAELSKAIAGLVSRVKPEVIIAPSSETGNSVVAFLGASIGHSPIFECSQLELGISEPELVATKPIYQGRFLAQVTSPKPQIFTLFTSDLPVPFEDQSRYGKAVEWKIGAKQSIKVVSDSPIEAQQEKRIAIVGGRGLRTSENFSMVEKLGQLMRAEVYSAPSAADVGIAGSIIAVGPSRKIDSKICIVIAIGQTNEDLLHINSGTIVAVERDQDCPAVRLSRIALIGEPEELVRLWIDLLQRKT